MEVLILVLFIVEIFIFSKIDKILYGTYITPVTVVSVPYLLVVLLAIFLGPSLGFYNFYFPSLWIWIIGVFLFWMPSSILATFILRKTNIYTYPYVINSNKATDKFMLFISYFLIVILFVGLFKSVRTASIGTDEFGTVFGTGISGHVLLISKFFFVYLIVRFKKKYIIPITLFLLFYLIYGVKGWVFIPILSGILIRVLLKESKFSIKLLVKIIVFVFLVFYIIYKLSLGDKMPSYFVFHHIFRYLFSGVLGLSEYVKHKGAVGIHPVVVVSPVINLYKSIFGGGKYIGIDNINTHIGEYSASNVKTLFGTIYVFAGLIWGSVFCIFIGALSYFSLIVTIKLKNIFFLIIYGTFVTLFFFGFFDTYSGNLFFYEFPVFGVLFFIFYQILVNIRKRHYFESYI